MNAQPVLITATHKQSVAIQMVHSLAVVTKDTHSKFLYKVYTFSFKSFHPTTPCFPFCNKMSKQTCKTAPTNNLLEYLPNFCTHFMLCSYNLPQ